ncbi:hypothetical protein KSP40_PGU014187 [Platanthera guangdongensis]|uniref:Uncharacterized protein n=1 Tax=Platanthera guangdongensis TaxID=2320717 RepID=A0ABR2MT07_9ASPA
MDLSPERNTGIVHSGTDSMSPSHSNLPPPPPLARSVGHSPLRLDAPHRVSPLPTPQSPNLGTEYTEIYLKKQSVLNRHLKTSGMHEKLVGRFNENSFLKEISSFKSNELVVVSEVKSMKTKTIGSGGSSFIIGFLSLHHIFARAMLVLDALGRPSTASRWPSPASAPATPASARA